MNSIQIKDVARSALTGFVWGVCSAPFVMFVLLLVESAISKNEVMNVVKVYLFTGFHAIVCMFTIGISNFRHRREMRRFEESGMLNPR